MLTRLAVMVTYTIRQSQIIWSLLRPSKGRPKSQQYSGTFSSDISRKTPHSSTFLHNDETFKKVEELETDLRAELFNHQLLRR